MVATTERLAEQCLARKRVMDAARNVVSGSYAGSTAVDLSVPKEAVDELDAALKALRRIEIAIGRPDQWAPGPEAVLTFCR